MVRVLFLGWLVALAMLVLRLTCRTRVHDDPRCRLRSRGEPYAYCVLHAHQVAMAINGERGTAAMVSQSTDGELLSVGLRLLGITIYRGSNQSRRGNKRGRLALGELIGHVRRGLPAFLAVDGPRGPRNHVRKGIAVLSQTTHAVVVPVVAIPRHRWVLSRSWDRIQIPRPFTTIDAYFGEPVHPCEDEGVESYRCRIERSLNDLEHRHDPVEANRDGCMASSRG